MDELEQLKQRKNMLSEHLSTLEQRLFDLEAERRVLLVALGR